MVDLRRSLAPLSEKAWAAVEGEARKTLRLSLAGRKLADFRGPLGWEQDAVNRGRVRPLPEANGGAAGCSVRETLPMIEFRVPFEVSREELENVDRGASDADLQPVIEGARKAALLEDRMVFHGLSEAGIAGLVDHSDHARRSLPGNVEEIPLEVAEAARSLREAGVDGPYAMALGSESYTRLVQAPAGGGYPVVDRLRNVVSGPLVWAPALKGAVVVSVRGGDFRLSVGQDLSIGYDSHTAESVSLFFVESATFEILSPEAVVTLTRS